MTDTNSTIVLYTLVNTELKSMGRGKTAAQVQHAGNQLVSEYILDRTKPIAASIRQWYGQAEGNFGTSIVLDGVDLSRITEAMERIPTCFPQGEVFDPTYPYVVSQEIVHLIDEVFHTKPPVALDNGDFMCFREQMTCAYVLGAKDLLAPYLSGFNLLSNDPTPRNNDRK